MKVYDLKVEVHACKYVILSGCQSSLIYQNVVACAAVLCFRAALIIVPSFRKEIQRFLTFIIVLIFSVVK